jgi:hypothetical protein
MLFQVRPCVDQLGIGIFHPLLAIWVVQRHPFRKDIADRGIDRAGQEAMGLMEALDDLRGDTAYERERAGRFRAFQLHPAPGGKAYIMILWDAAPDLAHGNRD